jgi:glycosyltransferase involved in cell wall biosynthesis
VTQRLLIISQVQYGSHIDPYQYTRYLRDRFAITLLCWDYGYPRVEEPGVNVIYVSRSGGMVQRLSRFIKESLREIKEGNPDLIFVVYFQGSVMLPLISRRRSDMVLDIRTGYVRGGELSRRINNFLILFESFFYRRVTIISESLRKYLRIAAAKSFVLPLGAEYVHAAPKSFEEMRLLYIGTLQHRSIEKTVEGFSRFHDQQHENVDMTYVIVGAGPEEDVRRLREAISRSSCSHHIQYVGWVEFRDLGKYLEAANIGVAFIPLEEHFQAQPATKVFEYLLAGMPVIATRTYENARSIDDSNGVLVSDTPEDFCRGLHELRDARSRFDSAAISRASESYTWSHIINQQFYPFLVSLMEKR